MENIPDDATGAALKQWQLEGSDLSKPMKIDFFVSVPDEEAGNRLARDHDLAAFSSSVEQDAESGAWTVYCTRVLIPTYASIVQLEMLLSKVADRYGGFSDGFGSFGNAES